MLRRGRCWHAMAATISRTFSSMWRVGAAKRHARPRNEHAFDVRAGDLAAAHRRDGDALSLSAALVVVARARPDLLARGATLRLGLPAILHFAEFRLLRP